MSCKVLVDKFDHLCFKLYDKVDGSEDDEVSSKAFGEGKKTITKSETGFAVCL